MSQQSKKASGQHPDNSERPFVISIWPEGANPDVDEPALRVPSDVRGTAIGVVRRGGGYSRIYFAGDRIVDRLHVLRANQSPDWLARWGADIDAAIRSLDNRNGAPRKIDKAIEALYKAAAGGPLTSALVTTIAQEHGLTFDYLNNARRELVNAGEHRLVLQRKTSKK
jgi:hypothetical protein